MDFKGKVAVVTGGASGIGRATAIRLAEEGASVAVADMNYEGALDTAEQINSKGGRAIALKVDVRDKQQTEEMAEKTLKAYGKIDILVTSAGILEEVSIDDMTQEDWDRTIDTNLTGVVYSTQAVLPSMQKQKYGKIVVISSIAAWRGRAKQIPYCAAAGALTSFTENTAVQMGPDGIYVNCVAPGIIDTDFPESLKDEPEYKEFRRNYTPLRRAGTAEEVTGPVLFLASDDASYVTGETMIVDGGVSIHTNGFGL